MRYWQFLVGVLVCGLLGCPKPSNKSEVLTLATTTSTRDSGLLDTLLPLFTKQTGIEVKVVAVGSGQALELGRRGDADILLTHAPEAEAQFMAEGHGETRQPVMYNDFIIVGPKADPAKIRGTPSSSEAFLKLAKSQAKFISRGDESGTHQKEQRIWEKANVAPEGEWYLRAGSGMAQTLRMANEKGAYTLTDRATFLAQQQHLDLLIMCEGDVLLRNNYSVLVLNPDKHPTANHSAAKQFASFLLSATAQQEIAKFGIAEHGQPLFFPNNVESQP